MYVQTGYLNRSQSAFLHSTFASYSSSIWIEAVVIPLSSYFIRSLFLSIWY